MWWQKATAHGSAMQSQLHWFTMSTSLIHHVLHVGQTIHVDSLKPTTLTRKATAFGDLPSVSLAITYPSIKWRYYYMQALALLGWSICQKCTWICIISKHCSWHLKLLRLLVCTFIVVLHVVIIVSWKKDILRLVFLVRMASNFPYVPRNIKLKWNLMISLFIFLHT